MIAITASPDSETRRELTEVLTGVGWTVPHALDAEDTVECCRGAEVDVLPVDEAPAADVAGRATARTEAAPSR